MIDALPEPGGQVTAMYPEKMIFDVAGFPGIRGRDLVANLVEQAAQFHPQYLLGVRAEELSTTTATARADHVRRHRPAPAAPCSSPAAWAASPPARCPAADGFPGTGLVFFVPHLADLAGHDVVIVGGGDSAFDWALALQPLAKSVTLVHRREKFRAHASTVARAQALPIEIIVNAEVTAAPRRRAAAPASRSRSGAPSRGPLPADSVVAALGFTADLGPLADWGLELDKRHIKVDSTTATNLPRVFAAGDISEYPGKVRLIAVGFGEAATAVNNAAVIIDPAAHLFPGHSSDNG